MNDIEMENLKLYHILSTLNQNSVSSVQTGNGFTEIDRYLHIERPVTDELLSKMIQIDEAGGGIILLVGSAGDGKSHLLSKIKDIDPERWPVESFYNDATASCSPNKTAIETLREGLIDFSDKNIRRTRKRKILAINLGKLNAFIDGPEINQIYGEISNAVRPLFEDKENTPNETERVKVVEFTNKQIFEFYPSKEGYEALESNFMSKILNKIVSSKDPDNPQKRNPFYDAYIEDLRNNIDSKKNPIILNFQLLMLPEIRKAVILYVIECIIRYNLTITPREFLDFVYSLIVPPNFSIYKEKDSFYESLLPSLFFSGGNNTILKSLSKLDPLKQSSTSHDETLSLLFTSNSIPNEFLPKALSIPDFVIIRTNQFYNNNGYDIERTTKFLFRFKHLLDYHSECETYIRFLDSLKIIFSEDSCGYNNLYQMVTLAIPRHYGSYVSMPDKIPLNIQGGKYKLFATLQMDPIVPEYKYTSNKPYEFYPQYKLAWELPMSKITELLIDFPLFSYLYELNQGKLAISYENDKNIRFGNFIRDLASISDQSKVINVISSDGKDLIMRESFNSLQIQ